MSQSYIKSLINGYSVVHTSPPSAAGTPTSASTTHLRRQFNKKLAPRFSMSELQFLRMFQAQPDDTVPKPYISGKL